MTRSLRATLAIFTTITLGVVLGATQAQASDGKAYPGNMCMPAQGSVGDAEYQYHGAVCNTNTSSNLSLYCPIVREDLSAGAMDRLIVRGRSAKSNEDMQCKGWSNQFDDDDDTTYGWYTSWIYIGRSVVDFDNYLVEGYMSSIGEEDNGSFTMKCILPESTDGYTSCLFSYYHRES